MPQNDRAIGARIVFLFYVGRCLFFFPRTASGFFPIPSAYFFLCTGARPHVAIKHGVLSEARLMHFRRQSHARCLFISAALLFIFSKAYHLITTVCFVWIDCAFLSSVSGFFPDENTVCVYFVFPFSVQSLCGTSLTFHDTLLIAPDWRSHLAILT